MTRATAREKDEWFRDAFAAEYLDLYAHRDGRDADRAVEFVARELAFGPKTRALDLCCGAGRHLRRMAPLVRSAVGLDLSLDLLHRAERRAAPGESLVRGDMRRLPFADGAFDAVANLFTSFGYFADDSENDRTLSEIARVLRPGGLFLIDHINRDRLLAHLPLATERSLRDGSLAIEERAFEVAASRVVKRVRRVAPDGAERTWIESVRVYSSEELASALARAGLRPTRTFGDFDGSPLSPDSPRMIALAEREGGSRS